MLNLQPVEKQEIKVNSLDVQEIFTTLQGEGPEAGTPAVFCRLAGCNLCCKKCDTDYTSKRGVMDVSEVVARIKELVPVNGIVVLTGGEPFRQNLTPLLKEITNYNIARKVQIETNGTLSLPYDPVFSLPPIEIICSPKTPNISAVLCKNIRAYKYVVEAGKVDAHDGLPTNVLGLECWVARPHTDFTGDVFIQPQDDEDSQKNQENVRTAVDCCLKFGYRLSLQMHKIVNLP